VQPAYTPSRSWPRTIPVTFGSLIAANRLWADGTQSALYGHVIGERWTITPTDATVEFRCTGTGTWDAEGPPRVPIGGRIDPTTGKYCIPVGYPCDTINDVIVKNADGDIIATYPPGSLCYCETGGGIVIPDGGVEVCLVNDFGEICVDVEDPRIMAILWFDVLEPGPDLIERVDGDAITPLAGFASTTLDEIPGDFDAIHGVAGGGPLGASHSDHVEDASFSGGWTIDWWFRLGTQLDEATDIDIIDLDQIVVRLTTSYQETGPFLTQLDILVFGEDPDSPGDPHVFHSVGPLAYVDADDDWHHYVVTWDAGPPGEITVIIDGVPV